MKENRSAQRGISSAFLTGAAAAFSLMTLALAASRRAARPSPRRTRRRRPQPRAIAQPGAVIKRQPPHYVGTVYCYACHQELSLEFAKTKMGKLFLVKPQNDLERKGCEGCHGPASDHAESGGGLGVGGMAEFRIDHGQIDRTQQPGLSRMS